MIKEKSIELIKNDLEINIKNKYIKTNNRGRPLSLSIRDTLDAIFLCSS